MTRKKLTNAAAVEFLNNQPEGYFHTESERNTAHTGFIMGARWADKHQWRAVADGAPSPGSSWVLGAFENGDIRIVRYSYACYMWLYMDNEEASAPVYWMPIPELPK